MVRRYILTDLERKTLKFYFNEGLKLNGFRQLKRLCRELDISRINEDLDLIKRLKAEDSVKGTRARDVKEEVE